MGKNLDGRSDLFSLGIVLYELCTCDALFPRNNAVQAMQLIRKAEIPDPKRLGRRLPKELTRILRRALAGDRDKRYQTGAEMQMDLEEYLRSTTQISNSILLGGYFTEHYRRLRPEPGRSDEQAAHVGGTRLAGAGTATAAPGTAPVDGLDDPTDVVLYSRPEALKSISEPEPPPMPETAVAETSGPDEVSGIIYQQPTVIKGQALDPNATAASLQPTIASYEHATVERAISDQYDGPTDLESPTVEFTPGPRIATGSARALYPATPEAETVLEPFAPRHSQSHQVLASTTLSVRRFGRRLAVAGLITAIAVAGVLAGYFISAPPTVDRQTAALPDAGSAARVMPPPTSPALAEADAAVAEGMLEVNSDPPGASLKVDDLVIAGVTPVRRSFAAGPHTLLVSLPGYADQVQEVELGGGEEMKVNFVLRRAESEKVVQLRQADLPRAAHPKPNVRIKRRHKSKRKARPKRRPRTHARAADRATQFGYLFITTQPWSHVYLGRRKLGTTPLARVKVPVGTHRLFFTNPNHGEASRVVTVRPGQVVKLRVEL